MAGAVVFQMIRSLSGIRDTLEHFCGFERTANYRVIDPDIGSGGVKVISLVEPLIRSCELGVSHRQDRTTDTKQRDLIIHFDLQVDIYLPLRTR